MSNLTALFKKMDRKTFLKLLAAIPVLGALGSLASPLYRVLRPSAGPYDFLKPPDRAETKPQIVAKISDLPTDWSSVDFIYEQVNVEYTSRGVQTNKIPGTVIRLPQQYVKGTRPEDQFFVASRICTHLGCIFRFWTDPGEVARGFNYTPKNPVFACPCHLSVYDPTQVNADGQRGVVVSGPAPRPPRTFTIRIDGNDIYVTGMESGGIA